MQIMQTFVYHFGQKWVDVRHSRCKITSRHTNAIFLWNQFIRILRTPHHATHYTFSYFSRISRLCAIEWNIVKMSKKMVFPLIFVLLNMRPWQILLLFFFFLPQYTTLANQMSKRTRASFYNYVQSPHSTLWMSAIAVEWVSNEYHWMNWLLDEPTDGAQFYRDTPSANVCDATVAISSHIHTSIESFFSFFFSSETFRIYAIVEMKIILRWIDLGRKTLFLKLYTIHFRFTSCINLLYQFIIFIIIVYCSYQMR